MWKKPNKSEANYQHCLWLCWLWSIKTTIVYMPLLAQYSFVKTISIIFKSRIIYNHFQLVGAWWTSKLWHCHWPLALFPVFLVPTCCWTSNDRLSCCWIVLTHSYWDLVTFRNKEGCSWLHCYSAVKIPHSTDYHGRTKCNCSDSFHS